MNIKLSNDEEILMLINENNEDAKIILLNKYSHVIDILIAKYNTIFYHLGIEIDDARGEALVGFSDAISSYNCNKCSSFESFLSLCIKRKLIKLIRKYNTNKSKFNNQVYSLDYVYTNNYNSLVDSIKAEDIHDPLLKLTDNETVEMLTSIIENKLSDFEFEVYLLMLDGLGYVEIAKIMKVNEKKIDNAIQRIRVKIKNILENIRE